ncbi:ABC transporter ATP-binding protein [uncultured Tyzzerella sp.]|uniref:ABC transporter ATP-binding protein n=1 Tax=uncultured Tyzzerella sp. TaxID=2321398 RepID=UPI002943320D|nr:ABC transporter ATP-binding protein [uncultured Tyzzerella sp.]
MQLFKFILNYLKKYKYRYFAGILMLFIVDFMSILIPKITGTIIDGLTLNNITIKNVYIYILGIICVGLIIAIGRFFWRFFIFGAARNIEKEIRNGMFNHLEKMSVEYFNEHKAGDLMTRFLSDLTAVRKAIGATVISIFDATVMTLMVVVQMMVDVNIKLTLIAIIPMLLICIGEIYYGKIMEKRFRESQEAISSMADFVQESFSGVRVIKAFVRQKAEFYRFNKANLLSKEKNLSVVKLQSVVMPLLDVIIGLSSLITLIYGGYLALVGEITLGKFVAFNQYVSMLVWPMLACGETITMLSQGGASLKRIKDVFDEKPEIFDRDDVEDIERIKGKIEFKNLTFIHRGHSEPTLNNINLKVEDGTTLAIIGKTGNGKSTLVNLLLHLYNANDGMIFIDGKDINSIPLKTLRENIAYVPQDNFLFSNTLKSNIAFGMEEEEMEKIKKATIEACIHDNIIDFPKGYETIVGERGVTLSGGQKQRSSIARALIKDAPILILDDALSAVDTNTEESILKNLKENRKGKTTILIAHRISTIKNADVIMVLDDGKIREVGTHTQLIDNNDIYKDMFEQQKLEEALEEKEKNINKEINDM